MTDKFSQILKYYKQGKLSGIEAYQAIIDEVGYIKSKAYTKGQQYDKSLQDISQGNDKTQTQ